MTIRNRGIRGVYMETNTSVYGVLGAEASSLAVRGGYLSQLLALPYTTINALALVVAGGGGAGWDASGGGGAGGLISNTVGLQSTGNYTVTVGAGGTYGTALGINGSNGTNSSAFSIVARGGGGGGSKATRGYDGASGGGSGHTFTSNAGLGIVGQGNNGGAANADTGGGGGGAGAAGTAGGTNLGAGGIGIQSSITGSTLYYAGGGGGGTYQTSRTSNSGGSGGGGSGGTSSVTATSGAANTGGGGGGHGHAENTGNPGAGGSGVVIINYPAPQQFTGGIVTNVNNLAGSNIVHTFTSSGSLNALGYSIDTYFPQTTLLLHGDGTNGANNTVFLNSAANTYIPFDGTYSGYFSTSGSYLTITPTSALALGTGDWTYEFWIYWTGVTTTDADFYRIGTTDWAIGVYNTAASLGIVNLAGAERLYFGSKNQIPVNAWTHIAFTRSGNSFRCFINGTIDSAGVLTSTASMFNTTGTATNLFKGFSSPVYISNARLVKGTALYTANFTPPTSALTAVSGTALLTCQSPLFVDNSTNNLTITQTGGPLITSGGVPVATNGKPQQGTFSPFSQTGWSNYFNGSSDYFTTSANALNQLTSDFTVEFWVYPTNLGTQQGCVNITNTTSSGSNGLSIFFDTSNRIGFFVNGTSTVTYSGNNIVSNNNWYHIALVRSGSTNTLYVNGVSVATSSTTPTWPATPSIGVGRMYNDNTGILLTGYLSNVRIIKGTAQYTSTFTPPTASLTAITNTLFLTCQSNKFIDNSTNAFALTLAGTPSVQPLSPFSPSAAYSNTAVGGSAYFSTKTDGLDLSGTADLTTFAGNFTIESWVYPTDTSLTNFWTLYDGRAAGGTSAAFIFGLASYQNSLGYLLTYFNSGTTVQSTGRVQVNSWSHVALERVGTTVTFYINGQASGTFTLSGTLTASGSGGTIRIGSKDSGLSGYGILGYISNYRITNGTAAYNGSFTPSTAPFTSSSVSNTKLLLNATNAGIIDQTAKNNITTYGTAAISSTQSKFDNTSMYFDGSTGYIAAANTLSGELGTGDFTIEMWMRASAAGTYVAMVGTQTISGFTTAGMWRVSNRQNSTNALYFNYTTGSAFTDVSLSATNINDGNWHHIAVTRQSGTLRGFIDGVLGSNASVTQSLSSGKQIYIGFQAQDNKFYSGYLDDVRITKGYARYTANFTPPTSAFLNR